MTSANLAQAKEYLAKVLPWPGEDGPVAYVNIHWTFSPKDGPKVDKKGKAIYPWSGRAVRSVAEAANVIEWALGNADTRDIYVCLSTQARAEAKISKAGRTYYRAIREQTSAVALKSLFIDIDAKGADRGGYDTPQEAVAALSKFIADVNFPKPSALVSSGGGFHVYWTFDRAIPPGEWQPLANALAEATKKHGLKCDTQCTVDSVRVLRVPNTLNRKTEPGRPVTLVGNRTGYDYSVEKFAALLEPYKTTALQSSAPSNVIDLSLFPRRAPLPSTVPPLSAGIDPGGVPPPPLRDTAIECGFIREAVITRGATYSNPLWNLTTLIAVFLAEGEVAAQRMASGHPDYTAETTHELFERKKRERAQKNLGWPSCQTISASGSTACQKCPHFNQGKSPLNFGSQRALAAPQNSSPQKSVGAMPMASVTSADLPNGYARRPDGIICKVEADEEGNQQQLPICNYPMIQPWIQRDPWELHFVTFVDAHTKIKVPKEIIGSQEMRKTLQSQGMMLHANMVKPVEEFLVSWIEKLKNAKDAVVSTVPFGWSETGNKVDGFTYAGVLWTPAGEKLAPVMDREVAGQYSPQGDTQPWLEAAKMVVSENRPALDAIIASAFAAPLAYFTRQTGLVMSAYSTESGIGKTTAMRVAQAVWGDPIRAVNGLTDTENSLLEKMGLLKNIPVYWDELKSNEEIEAYNRIVFRSAGGKGKSRLNSKLQQRKVFIWQTMLVSASNGSMIDEVIKRTKTTPAGVNRVFEFEVTPRVIKKITSADADQILGATYRNYGHIGLAYAKFLGANIARIEKEVPEIVKQIVTEMQGQEEERFWTATISVLLLGAKYANELGFTQINLDALKVFLADILGRMRRSRSTSNTNMKSEEDVANILGEFLADMRGRHTLKTNKIWTGQGKPPVGAISIVGDVSRLEAIHVHIGMDDKVLRVSSAALNEWLEKKTIGRHIFFKALEVLFGARAEQVRMGSGTALATVRTYVLEINLSGSRVLNFIDEA